jgi:hypothetical protein
MGQYNTFYNLQLAHFDSISKFNILNFNQLLKLKNLNIIIPLSTSEPNFLKNYMILTKVLKEVFNRKPSVFFVKKNFQRGSKFRNNLVFSIGITLRKNEIFLNLNYLLNIVIPLIKKVNSSIILNNIFKNIFIIKFFSMNHLLGISNFSYYNIVLEFNYNINFLSKNKSIIFNKFYEKFFF